MRSTTDLRRTAFDLGTSAFDNVRVGLPILPLAIAFGMAFGLAANEAGLDVVTATAMSALAYAGSAQFATVGVLAAGGAPLVAILAGLLANTRYVPMGIAIAQHGRGALWQRFVGAQAMIDESWALAHSESGFSWSRMVGTGSVFWVGWVSGTLLGALIGPAVGDISRLGMDGALAAIFLALAVAQVRTRMAAVAAALGVGVVLVTTPVLPPGIPVAAATLACLVGLRR